MAETRGRQLGKFRLLKPIGAGVMGEVFLAEHAERKERCAVKILPDAYTRDPDFPARLEDVAWRIHSLDHPGLVKVRHVGHEDGVYFLAMDYVAGLAGPARSLQHRLDPLGRRGLGARKVRALAVPILEALAHAHERGVLHLSLKPSSVLLDANGRPRIVDCGLASIVGAQLVAARTLAVRHGATGRLPTWGDSSASTPEAEPVAASPAGRSPPPSDAPRYLAPEQRHERPLDARTDLYAFGVMLYRMLTGSPAERITAEPSPYVRGVSPAWIDVANRCKLEFPAERYPSASMVKAAILAIPRARSPVSRRLVLRASAVGLALLAVVWLVTRACGPLADQVAALEWGAFETVRLPGQVRMRFVRVPAGELVRGEPGGGRRDPESVHRVTLTRPFHLSTTEVTQAQWRAVMDENPSEYRDRPDRPVERVSWHDCQRFLDALNRLGLGTFRLPTEAEWEYACRAGTSTRYPWGDEAGAELDAHAWHPGNAGGTTHPVARKKPNAWGLHDMCGNVGEWCQDHYGPYPREPVVDPKGPRYGPQRVHRGGSYFRATGDCRPAGRHPCDPKVRIAFIGFRVVRAVEE